MKINSSSRTYLLGFGFVAALLIARFALINIPQRNYQKLVSNTGLINAFMNHNEHGIDTYARDYQLEYQSFKDGKLAYTTNSGLPVPTIVSQAAPLPGVIQAKVSNLKALQPYTTWLDGSMYVFFSLVNSQNSDNVYIIYHKVLL